MESAETHSIRYVTGGPKRVAAGAVFGNLKHPGCPDPDRVGRKRDPIIEEGILALHQCRWSNAQIGQALKVRCPDVYKVLRKYGLRKNPTPTWDKDMARRLLGMGFNDEETAAFVGCRSLAVLRFRQREGIPANHRGGRGVRRVLFGSDLYG